MLALIAFVKISSMEQEIRCLCYASFFLSTIYYIATSKVTITCKIILFFYAIMQQIKMSNLLSPLYPYYVQGTYMSLQIFYDYYRKKKSDIIPNFKSIPHSSLVGLYRFNIKCISCKLDNI